MIADTRTKYVESFFYTPKQSYICKDCGLPLPRYSGLLDAFSNLLITVTSSSHVAVQLAVLCRCFQLSACMFSGKNVDANNSFMVLFEEMQLGSLPWSICCGVSQVSLTQPL